MINMFFDKFNFNFGHPFHIVLSIVFLFLMMFISISYDNLKYNFFMKFNHLSLMMFFLKNSIDFSVLTACIIRCTSDEHKHSEFIWYFSDICNNIGYMTNPCNLEECFMKIFVFLLCAVLLAYFMIFLTHCSMYGWYFMLKHLPKSINIGWVMKSQNTKCYAKEDESWVKVIEANWEFRSINVFNIFAVIRYTAAFHEKWMVQEGMGFFKLFFYALLNYALFNDSLYFEKLIKLFFSYFKNFKS